MTESEQQFNPEEERRPFSYQELRAIIAEVEDKISEFYDAYRVAYR